MRPHCLRVTVKAVHTLSYSLPGKKCVAVRGVQDWLVAHAHLEGARYTSWTPKGHAALRVYQTVWNEDWDTLEQLLFQSCPGAGCVCIPLALGGL